MKHKRIIFVLFTVAGLVMLATVGIGSRVLALGSAQPAIGAVANVLNLGTGFTYQGLLQDNGNPINDSCDLTFALYDAATGGNQIGATETESSVAVSEGRFTVQLNEAGQFGPDAFNGQARWLQVAVRCPAGSGIFDPLAPRQPLTASPYSLFSAGAAWSGLKGIPAGFADGIDDTGSSLPGHTVHVAVPANGSPVSEPQLLIGSDGLPLLSYRQGNNVWALHCQEPTCAPPVSSTAVFSGTLQGLAMTLESDGLGMMTVGDEVSGILIRRCANAACTSFTGPPGTISLGTKVQETAITMGIDGLPVIGFVDVSGEVGLLHCNDADCATYTVQSGTIDDAHSLSITIAEYGHVVLAYASNDPTYDESIIALRCSDVTCSNTITTMLLTCDVGGIDAPCVAPFVTTDNEGSLRAGYVARFGDGSGWVRTSDGLTLPVHGGTISYDTALVIRSDGTSLLIFNYLGTDDQFGNPQFNGGLAAMYGQTSDPFVQEDYHVNLDDDIVSTEVAATTGADSLPVIAYINADDALAFVHCGNPLCLPYYRR